MARDGAEMNRRTLRFKSALLEKTYMAKLHRRLAATIAAGSGGMVLFIVVVMMNGTVNAGGLFLSVEGTKDASLLARTVAINLGVISFAVMIVALMEWRHPIIGPFRLELLMTTALLLITCAHPLTHAWYGCKAVGIEDPLPFMVDDVDWKDHYFILYQQLYLAAVHLMVPARWIVLWPLEVAPPVVYLSIAFGLGSPMGLYSKCVNAMTIALCSVFLAVGKRNSELHLRRSFSDEALEKTPSQAEFPRSSNVGAQNHGQESAPAFGAMSTSSKPVLASAKSADGDLWSQISGAGDINEQLAALVKLGTAEQWLVDQRHLQLSPQGSLLGVGGFGIAAVATYYGAEVCVKAARLPKTGPKQLRHNASVVNELRTLRRLRHPNIVLFYGACIVTKTLDMMLVLEYVRGPTLSQVVLMMADQLTTMGRCRILSDVCCALRYLHGLRPVVVHGDIKGCNVLVERAGDILQAKVVDFGLSHVLTKQVDADAGGTLRWAAPEVLLGQCRSQTTHSDIFSFGRLVFFVMTGLTPLHGVEDRIIADARDGVQTPLAWPKGRALPLLAEARNLAESCVNLDRKDRPDAVQVHLELLDWPAVDAEAPLPGSEQPPESLGECFPFQPDNSASSSAFGKAMQQLREDIVLAGAAAGNGGRTPPPPQGPMRWPDGVGVPQTSSMRSLSSEQTMASDLPALARRLRPDGEWRGALIESI